ncbi:MAG: hypothetical protein AAFV01_01440 [Bacteroidota bacterium]
MPKQHPLKQEGTLVSTYINFAGVGALFYGLMVAIDIFASTDGDVISALFGAGPSIFAATVTFGLASIVHSLYILRLEAERRDPLRDETVLPNHVSTEEHA